jgi:iron-sulfur cluster repair protein YtfE (RIC family)
MHAALEKILQSLTDHVRHEERVLVTLLPRTQDSGRSLRLLREDHALQLEELESMRRCAARSDDAISLALAIRAFVADVQLEMDLEDRRYLSVDGRISDRT